MHTISTVLRIALAIGLLLYLGFSGALEWSALLRLADAWPLALVGFFILLAAMMLMAWRLRIMLKPRGFLLSLATSFRLTMIGIFFNNCLPGSAGGDVVKIYYATKGNRGKRTEVATILLLDRAAGMFAILLWPLLAVPFFSEMVAALPVLRGLLWAAAGVVAAMLVGLWIGTASNVLNSQWMTWVFHKLPMGRYARNTLEIVHAYRSHWRTLLAAVGISLLIHTMVFSVTLLAAMAINASDIEWQMVLLMPLGFLANVLPLTPGGLGVGEAAFDTLFSMAGLSGGAEALLGWRLLMLLVGLIGLFFYAQGRKRFVYGKLPHSGKEEALLLVEEPGIHLS